MSSEARATYGPTPGFDVEACSGILGSISIACWVFVFSPQIVENFRRSSAEGLSIVFLVIWLLGDLFNILGAALQGVLPTMIILAVYYTIADIVLIAQCFYYKGFTLSDGPPALPEDSDGSILDGTEQDTDNVLANGDSSAIEDDRDDETPLLSRTESPVRPTAPHLPLPSDSEGTMRRGSTTSLIQSINSVDGTHLNPVVPLVDSSRDEPSPPDAAKKPLSTFWSALFNFAALLMVCLAGFLGWWLSARAGRSPYENHEEDDLSPSPDNHRYRHGDGSVTMPFDVWGQIFGYLCAVLYLGSRVPQLLLNYRRKSTEGVSMLFFLFACVGNLTYVLSIFVYEPPCARWDSTLDYHTGQPFGYQDYCRKGEWGAQYGRYIAVNTSWLIGSAGTLLLDAGVFVQFYMYRGLSPNEGTIRIHTVPNSPVDARPQDESSQPQNST